MRSYIASHLPLTTSSNKSCHTSMMSQPSSLFPPHALEFIKLLKKILILFGTLSFLSTSHALPIIVSLLFFCLPSNISSRNLKRNAQSMDITITNFSPKEHTSTSFHHSSSLDAFTSSRSTLNFQFGCWWKLSFQLLDFITLEWISSNMHKW